MSLLKIVFIIFLNGIPTISVDGKYGSWSAWGSCTLTCASGTQQRSRSCSNPAPKYGGKSCSGTASQSQNCNTHNCPSK